MQSFLRCMGEWNSVNKGIKKTFTLSLKLYKNSICFFKKKKKKKTPSWFYTSRGCIINKFVHGT